MQFVEKNSFNVRSSVYSMRKGGSGIELLLFPMVHIGTRKFFEQVTERIKECDVVFLEGVGGKRADVLTLSYRCIRFIRRMDLVTQQESLDIGSFREKIINADIRGSGFTAKWRGQSIWFRLLIYALVPVYSLYLALFGTRHLIAENIAVEDLESSDEVLLTDKDTEKFGDILVNHRDTIIIQFISDFLLRNAGQSKTVAIVYGALHMRNIMNYLSEVEGYRIVDSEWLTVFDLY
ncbi:MAG: hypothetical protein ABI999_13550 [Acidobacteriota bacterium]